MSTETTYDFDAEAFSRAWLSVFTAVADDPGRPLLHKAIAIERWSEGVRLTATDGYILWSAFVPSFGQDNRPEFGELPDDEQIIVGCDEDFRARDLLKYAFKTVTAKDAMPQHLRLSFGPAPLDDGQFPGTEREQVSFSFPANAPVGERVVIAAVEGRYPEWRSLLTRPVKTTREAAFNPELLARAASVKRYYGEPMRFAFNGPTGSVLLSPIESNYPKPALIGAVMPVSVDKGAA